ncbi:MAG: KpsF/GutQ family sugar-phosphate isomerase [Candidatus Krumholzibacteria bacterium]|nr:KpsF/GutQ family sugar-phosphate isomerase [Candidatus Krumholzibacteria bacterium]
MESKLSANASPKVGSPSDAAETAQDRKRVQKDIDIARTVFSDEIEGLRKVQSRLDNDFHRAVESIYDCKGRLIISGVGKSGLIGKKIAATFTSTGTPSFYIHPVEAAHGDLGLVSKEDVVLFISNSGMSDEFRQLQPSLSKLGVTIIAITGNADSHLAKHSHIVLSCHVDHEACALDLAPTTSTTTALVMGDALACALMKRRDFRVEDFAKNHPSGILGRRLTLRVRELMRTGAAVPLVGSGTVLRDALFEMISKSVGCVGVQDEEGILRGIITDGDLKRILVRNPNAIDVPVHKVMTPNPKTVGGNVLAAVALNSMEMNPSGPLTMYFITDEDGLPVGILHLHDILKAGLGVE